MMVWVYKVEQKRHGCPIVCTPVCTPDFSNAYISAKNEDNVMKI